MYRQTVVVDSAVDACYIRLSDMPVRHTVELSEDILVDLDEFDIVVGVEVLDMSAPLPLSELCKKMHVREGDQRYLAKLQPSLEYSLQFSLASAPDATITARTSSHDLRPVRA